VNPFHVGCTTCRTPLRVTKPEAIGLILPCPKCGSMVEVAPPPGWSPDAPVSATGLTAPPISHSSTSSVAVPPAVATVPATELTETATGFGWFVPSISGFGLFVVGMLGWLIWSSLQEPTVVKNSPNKIETPTAVVEPAPVTSQAPKAEPAPATIKPPVTTEVVPSVTQPDVAPAVTTDVTEPQPVVKPTVVPTPPVPEEPSIAVAPVNKLVIEPVEPSTPVEPINPLTKPVTETPPSIVAEPPAVEPIAKPAQPNPVLPVVPLELAQIPLSPVVAKNLDLPISAVHYDRIPLHRLLQELSLLSGAPITVNYQSLQAQGLDLEYPITLKQRQTTLRKLLEQTAQAIQSEVITHGTHWELTRPSNTSITSTRFDVSDLALQDVTQVEKMIAIMRRQLQLENIPADAMTVQGQVLITQLPDAQVDAILVWLEKLRTARGLATRTKYDPNEPALRRFHPQRFELTTRWQQSEAALQRTVTAGFARPETLQTIVNHLQWSARVNLLWDYVALEKLQQSPASTATLTITNGTLREALQKFLSPLGMIAIPIDDHSFYLTTTEQATAQSTVEWYSWRDARSQDLPTDDTGWLNRLNMGLKSKSVAELQSAQLYWDMTGRALAVRASPVQHAELEQLIRTLKSVEKANK
jgi:hypothetical protein